MQLFHLKVKPLVIGIACFATITLTELSQMTLENDSLPGATKCCNWKVEAVGLHLYDLMGSEIRQVLSSVHQRCNN